MSVWRDDVCGIGGGERERGGELFTTVRLFWKVWWDAVCGIGRGCGAFQGRMAPPILEEPEGWAPPAREGWRAASGPANRGTSFIRNTHLHRTTIGPWA